MGGGRGEIEAAGVPECWWGCQGESELRIEVQADLR